MCRKCLCLHLKYFSWPQYLSVSIQIIRVMRVRFFNIFFWYPSLNFKLCLENHVFNFSAQVSNSSDILLRYSFSCDVKLLIKIILFTLELVLPSTIWSLILCLSCKFCVTLPKANWGFFQWCSLCNPHSDVVILIQFHHYALVWMHCGTLCVYLSCVSHNLC